MRILYQPNPEASFEIYRCRHSGREEFDLDEAVYRCRWLVRDGHAIDALAIEGEQITAQWRRQGSETVKIAGPDV